MKYIFFITVAFLTFYSLPVKASEQCEIVLLNFPFKRNVVISSDGKFLLENKSNHAVLYEKDQSGFRILSTIELEESPTDFFVSSEGYMVFYGNLPKYGVGYPQTDNLYLYKSDGSLVAVINAEKIMSDSDIQASIKLYSDGGLCPPPKPWICYDDKLGDGFINNSEPEDFDRYEDYDHDTTQETFVISDTLSNLIHIDVETGEIEKFEDEGDCLMWE